MSGIERTVNHPPKFGAIKRKVVTADAREFVTRQVIPGMESGPIKFQPAVPGVDLAAWCAAHRQELDAALHQFGGILFRGFGVSGADEFERCAQGAIGDLYADYGDLPREAVAGQVYGSTVYPPEETIWFHNESSHLNKWPLRISFHCAIKAPKGGETPLLDCRKVWNELRPELRAVFQERGLMYVRRFVEGLDVPWQEFFRTTDPAAVEAFCRENSLESEWRGPNDLRILKRRPAVMQHPRTGDWLFFNQLQLHHSYCLAPAVRQSLLSLFGSRDLPRCVFYGDGSEIEDHVMQELGELYQRLCVSFPWEVGDVILLDNMLMAHARLPFEGPRKILVAMGQMYGD